MACTVWGIDIPTLYMSICYLNLLHHAMFKVTSFIGFGLYLKSSSFIERYIRWWEEQLTNILTNPNHKFIEHDVSNRINWTPFLGVGVSAHTKVHYQFHKMLLQMHEETLYLKEIFQNMHVKFFNMPDHTSHPTSVNNSKATTPRVLTSQNHSK